MRSIKLHRLVTPSTQTNAALQDFRGKVVRFNYAKHGQANGFILDSGDFIHTRPHRFDQLGVQVGHKVTVSGESRPLFTGQGHAVEAVRVNEQALV